MTTQSPEPGGGPADRRKPHDGTDDPNAVMGHVGWPVDELVLGSRVRHGLPVYTPTDPVLIDQRPYIAFSATRGPNGG